MQKQRLQKRQQKYPRHSHRQLQKTKITNTEDKGVFKKGNKQIKKQKIAFQKTVQDEPNHKLQDLQLNIHHTPQYNKTSKQDPPKIYRHQDVQSFKIDDSFKNKHQTVKRQYHETFHPGKKQIVIHKEQISLMNIGKEPKKQKQNLKEEELKQNLSGNGLLNLKQGWSYSGQYVSGLFHGFGQLYHQNRLIYSGQFQLGYFHGHGKLQYHPSFDYLIQLTSIKYRPKNLLKLNDSFDTYTWKAYFGQFIKGHITGYGQLWVSTGQKIASRWLKGSIRGKHHVINEEES